MSALVVDCSNHRSLTEEGSGGSVVVEEVEGNVYLTLRAETDDGTSTYRVLVPDEARSLAAALNHFAAEVTRSC